MSHWVLGRLFLGAVSGSWVPYKILGRISRTGVSHLFSPNPQFPHSEFRIANPELPIQFPECRTRNSEIRSKLCAFTSNFSEFRIRKIGSRFRIERIGSELGNSEPGNYSDSRIPMFQILKPVFRDPKIRFGISNLHFRIQKTAFELQNSGFGISTPEFRDQFLEFRTGNSEFRNQFSELGKLDSEFRSRNSDSRIRNSESRFYGLGKSAHLPTYLQQDNFTLSYDTVGFRRLPTSFYRAQS